MAPYDDQGIQSNVFCVNPIADLRTSLRCVTVRAFDSGFSDWPVLLIEVGAPAGNAHLQAAMRYRGPAGDPLCRPARGLSFVS